MSHGPAKYEIAGPKYVPHPLGAAVETDTMCATHPAGLR